MVRESQILMTVQGVVRCHDGCFRVECRQAEIESQNEAGVSRPPQKNACRIRQWELPVDVVPLDCLHAGETGRIADVEGCVETVTRLAEIGLRNGALIRMVQPGSPCILALDNQRLSFRPEECTHVFVEVVPSGIVTV